MNKKRKFSGGSVILAVSFFLAPATAWATQGHAGIEGVWAHQFAHLFFLFSMGFLIYWLRKTGLVREHGWRYIQYAAFFFFLWNIDTILVHFLDEQVQLVKWQRLGNWEVRIVVQDGLEWLGPTYYLIKMDHLLCVPAMYFLWQGLKSMRTTADSSPSQGRADR